MTGSGSLSLFSFPGFSLPLIEQSKVKQLRYKKLKKQENAEKQTQKLDVAISGYPRKVHDYC